MNLIKLYPKTLNRFLYVSKVSLTAYIQTSTFNQELLFKFNKKCVLLYL